jgi:lipoprotein-anchoring transpeptidase ErfK/SrfK
VSKTPVIIVALVLVLLGGVAAGAVAYDRSHADRLAKGLTVNGVDVSGLTAREATARLQRVLLDPLQEPIVVDHGRKQWRLTAREARIASDVDGAVARALEVSRGGDLPTRVLRDLTGKELDEHVDSGITYSKPAVVRLLDRIRHDLERDPVSAKVTIDGAGPHRVSGRTGRAVLATQLHRKLRAAIVTPGAERRFSARTRKVQPKVTDKELEEKYATILIVDRPNFRIHLFKRLERAKTYRIALGKAGNDTPSGLYAIQNKAVDPVWHVPNSEWAGELAGKQIPPGPDNPIKARWMGIYDGVGVHGTSDRASIGHNASHGCIRMLEEDVIALYEQVPVGTPIYIS